MVFPTVAALVAAIKAFSSVTAAEWIPYSMVSPMINVMYNCLTSAPRRLGLVLENALMSLLSVLTSVEIVAISLSICAGVASATEAQKRKTREDLIWTMVN